MTPSSLGGRIRSGNNWPYEVALLKSLHPIYTQSLNDSCLSGHTILEHMISIVSSLILAPRFS